MPELVVDTNVLVHASNKKYPKVEDCLKLIERLKKSNEYICIDVGPTGLMYYEYQKHCPPGSEGYILLLLLDTSKRIKFVDRNIPSSINKKINKTGIKKQDRVFVRIAFKTDRRILVTQEYEDFTNKIRRIFKDEIDVNVIEAAEFTRDH